VIDLHVCPKVDPGPLPHLGGALLPGPGEPTVLIANFPAVREGDKAVCIGTGDTSNAVKEGTPVVLIGGKPAARQGDGMTHPGSVIVSGCPTVKIGSSPQGASFMAAGVPLVKRCDDPKAPPSV
jgi:uncharacterized Zn-binding protein involved in type VI secretion